MPALPQTIPHNLLQFSSFQCDYIGTLSELEGGENFGIISEEQVSEVIDKALAVVAAIIENDDIMGELLYADILNTTNIPDDSTANFIL